MSISAKFVEDTYLPELGLGAGFAIWGFRACSRGRAQHQCVVRGFTAAFGGDGASQINRMITFSKALGHEGKRMISLSMPGCARVTPDELSIIAVLSAAQARDNSLRDAHLTWLLSQAPNIDLSTIATEISDCFSAYGLQILAPKIEISIQHQDAPTFMVVSAGSA